MNDDPRSDDPRSDETARRVQDAVSAHGRTVQPDEDGSLPVIRHRVASARRRRLVGATALGAAAALVIGVAIGVAAGDDDTTTVAVGDGGSTTTTEPCPPSTPSPSSTTTTAAPSTASIPTTSTAPDSADAGGPSTTATVPLNAPLTAVPETTIPAQAEEEVLHAETNCGGPTTGTVPTTGTTTTTSAPSTTVVVADPASVIYPIGLPLPPDQVLPVAWRSPQGIAKAYIDHLGATRAELSAYDSVRKQIVVTSSNAPSGAVGGARTILTVVPVTGLACGPDGTCYETWAVQEARSPAIVVERAEVQPPADGQGHWTLALAGRARGFEGTIHVTVTGNGDVAWSAEDVVTASGGEELGPFSTFVDLGRPPVGRATVVLANESGEDGSPVDITAFPIQIAVP